MAIKIHWLASKKKKNIKKRWRGFKQCELRERVLQSWVRLNSWHCKIKSQINGKLVNNKRTFPMIR
jgi:hypothetical protein